MDRPAWVKLLFLLLFCCPVAFGQSLYKYENILLNQGGTPIVGANVWVCAGNVVPNFLATPPCALATVYSDANGTIPITQPMTTTPLGNYSFFLPSALATVVFTGQGVASSDLITPPAFPGVTLNGANAFTGVMLCKNFEQVRCVDSTNAVGWSGSDACAWITSAQLNLPSTGGTIDARGVTGAASCASALTIGSPTKPVTLLLSAGVTFTVNGQWIIGGSASHVIGVSGSTVISQGNSFPSNTPVLQIGNGSIVTGATFENLAVNNNGIANSIGGENISGQENSGFVNMVVQNCTKYGLWYEGSTAQNSFGRDWFILCSGAGAGTVNSYIHNVPSFRGISGGTFATNDGLTIGNGLVIDGTSGGVFQNLHFEHSTVCVDIGPTTQTRSIELQNIYGNPTCTTLVKIENTSGNRIMGLSLQSNGSPTIVNDALNSITRTDTIIPRYVTFGPTGNQVLIETGTTGQIFLRLGTNQNLKFESFSGLTSLESINDAGNEDTALNIFLPQLTGLANGTGLQVFNTSTTCTTGASIGSTCTTAAISLPVGYSDTSYRLSCTGVGTTNVPIVETYTKSNTTFTITIAALTAAAASFSSYDCIAGHN
jgi:hypothetical protein